jgi:hypothetical protein
VRISESKRRARLRFTLSLVPVQGRRLNFDNQSQN